MDPFPGVSSRPATRHAYGYGLNSPLRYVDPSGYFTEEEIERYLRSRYGDRWQKYRDAWKGDDVFWAMLREAQVGDTLLAPTTSLEGGVFKSNYLWGFRPDPNEGPGGLGLEYYQGYGPYQLFRGKGGKVDALGVCQGDAVSGRPSQQLLMHILGLMPSSWRQPIYRYTECGPEPTGYYRNVRYKASRIRPDLDEGDSTPFVIALMARLMEDGLAKGIYKAIAGPLSWFSFATGVDNSFAVDYDIEETWLRDEILPPGVPVPTYQPPQDLVR